MTGDANPFLSLYDKRLIFVSGKGGVGKTTTALMLALHFADQGQNVAIVEMNSTGRVGPYFNEQPTPREETTLTENLTTVNLIPTQCFEEYVLMHLKFKTVFNLIFNNKFVTNFLNAVPGLDAALMLGKIFDMQRREHKGKKIYDKIIVDAPATGHGLSALEVPHVMERAMKFGPMHQNAKQMNIIFGDPKITAFCLVTLAEEMPVCETEEYVKGLRAKTNVNFGPLFVNGVFPKTDDINISKNSKIPKEYLRYFDLAEKRAELHSEYLNEIKKSFRDFHKWITPFYFGDLQNLNDIRMLAKQIRSFDV